MGLGYSRLIDLRFRLGPKVGVGDRILTDSISIAFQSFLFISMEAIK